MDEAVKLGPALDALIRHKLKVVGVANGQRVPEDWHRLSANALVQRALRGGGSSAYRLDASDVSLIFTPLRRRRAAPHAPPPAARPDLPRTLVRRLTHVLHRSTRPTACAACSRTRRCASSRWSRTRTSPSAACCSSACARRSPSAASTRWSSTPRSAPTRMPRWRCSIWPSASSRCRRRSRTSRRAACRCASSTPPARRKAFLQRVAEAAPQCDVVLVHASASDLCRLFARSPDVERVRPLLLADDRPASVTHAYAAMKLLAQRAGLVVHDLLLGARRTRRAPSASRCRSRPAPTIFRRGAARLGPHRPGRRSHRGRRRASCAAGCASSPRWRPRPNRAAPSGAARPRTLLPAARATSRLTDFRSTPCTPPKASWT